MKIKVTYIVSSFMRCGPINMLYSLVAGLDPEQFEISAITLKPEPDNTRIKDFEALGVTVKRVGDRDTHLLFGLGRSIADRIKELHPDVVHTHGPWADYYGGAVRDIPTVVNIHNKLAEDYVPLYGGALGWLTTMMDARAMRRVTRAIAVSDSVASVAEAKYGIESDVIVNGVDIERYAVPDKDTSTKLRKALGISEDRYVFLHVGNMIQRKNPALILEAYQRAAEHMPLSELIFLGDGPLLEECRSNYENCSSIRFCGNVSNVSEFLSAADCVVSATASDGMSMATLEALACGLRGLMSNIDVHREIRERFVSNPAEFLVCEINVDAFAEGFRALYDQGRKKNTVEKKAISSAAMAKQYADLYKSLARPDASVAMSAK